MTRPGSTAFALSRALSVEGICLEVGPFQIRLRSELSGVARHVDQLYSTFSIQPSAGQGAHFDLSVVSTGGVRHWIRPQATLFANGAQPFFPLPAALAGPLVEWGLNWSIGRQAHRWVIVHAAVVERSGRALLLPAPPGSGKSTLCAALTYSGWRLFSDEFALIDPRSGRISPVPRPISLKEQSIEVIRRRHPDVVFGPEGRDVEGARFVHARPPQASVELAHVDAPAAWVVLPRYVAGREATLEPLPKAQALMQIADQSFNYNYLGAAGFRCLADVIRQARCLRLEFGDLDGALALLGQLTSG